LIPWVKIERSVGFGIGVWKFQISESPSDVSLAGFEER
jgi:hypothetical protein